MKNCTQLTESERNWIYALKQAGFKPSAIGLQLGRHKSTISRELQRNRGLRGYRPRQARQMAANRRREKAKPIIPEEIWTVVNNLLLKDWSPEQISGRPPRKICGSAMNASISILPATESGEGTCAFIYVAGRKEKTLWKRRSARPDKESGADRQAS